MLEKRMRFNTRRKVSASQAGPLGPGIRRDPDLKVRLVFLGTFLVFIALFNLSARAQTTAESTTTESTISAKELYDHISPSLVVVQYTYDGELGRRDFSSTGVVVREDGLVMASGALTPSGLPDSQMKDFKIIIPGDNDEELDAEFQGRDDRTNLTFVKAKESRKWTSLKFESVPTDVGDAVVAIGLLPKDAGYKAYLTKATVSAQLRGPTPQILVGEGLATVGAPVFNSSGQAIGMVHAQRESTPLLNDPREEMSSVLNPPRFFVPTRDFLISLSDPPVAGTPMQIPWVGLSQLSGLKKEVAEYFDLKNQPAVQVGDVIPGFPAEKAGLKSGDVIVRVDGKPLERGDDPEETPLIMTRKLMRLKIGQVVKFSILTKKDEPLREVSVTLAERPMQASRAKRFYAEDLGFTSRQIVFEDTYVRKLPADTKGVVVALVKPSSSAQTAKLQAGDLISKLNQTPVESLDQFKSQYETFRKDQLHEAVVLEVLRGVNTQVVRIEPPQ
jgi:serine protease Do